MFIKHISRRAEHWLTFGALLSLSFGSCVAPLSSVKAQTSATTIAPVAPAATLQAANRVLNERGNVVLTLTNSAFNTTRFRIGVFRAGQTQRLAEVRRNFALQNGALRTQVVLDAPPGDYELRLLSDDKARTVISAPALVTVAGIRREPGWWLFNGQPFVAQPFVTVPFDAQDNETPVAAPPNAPLFVAGLKRDLGKKSKSVSRTIPSNTMLQYRVLELPSLKQMAAPNYDFSALRAQMLKRINDARTNGQRNLTGFELPIGATNIDLVNPHPKVLIGRLRQVLNEVAPDAALILRVDEFPSWMHMPLLQEYAPLCDAVVLEVNGGRALDSLWPLKNLRRIAEEQPNYDLPILVRQKPYYAGPVSADIDMSEDSTIQQELLMGGATGLVEYSNSTPSAWRDVIRRNASLFVGSVTLEDIGVLVSLDRNSQTVDPPRGIIVDTSVAFYQALREAGRIPLAARLPNLFQKESERQYESLVVSLDNRVSNDTIERLRAAAKAGARIYIEGAPMQDEKGNRTAWRLGSLVGGDIKGVDAKSVDAKNTAMTLQDGWMFGTQRGQKLQVAQNVVVTLNKGTVVDRVKAEKGKDVLTSPRAAAFLEDGSPALVINPVGKGEVIWMPHRVLDSSPAMRRQFYAAVSNYVAPSLVTLRANDSSTDAGAVRVALRRSPKGALLLGLFNDSTRPARVAATIQGVAGVALDLGNERELPLQTRGNESEVNVSVPANGWALVAFAIDRKTLDSERSAAAGKVRLK